MDQQDRRGVKPADGALIHTLLKRVFLTVTRSSPKRILFCWMEEAAEKNSLSRVHFLVLVRKVGFSDGWKRPDVKSAVAHWYDRKSGVFLSARVYLSDYRNLPKLLFFSEQPINQGKLHSFQTQFADIRDSFLWSFLLFLFPIKCLLNAKTSYIWLTPNSWFNELLVKWMSAVWKTPRKRFRYSHK